MKRILFFLIFALLGSVFAAQSSSVPVYAKVSSVKPFSGDRLFAVLDSLGKGGNWMEWDASGVKDPSLTKALESVKSKPEMVWLISERTKPMLAVLVANGSGEDLIFFELAKIDAKPEDLKLKETLDPDVVFRDYRQISATEFVHRDKDNLKVSVNGSQIRFTYVNPDKEPLVFDPGFSTKTFVEKRSIVRDYMGFLKYEFSLMLRAFVQSTHGIFNWQPWHWYMPEWNSRYFIKNEELEAILAKGSAPAYFTIFKARAVGGETIEFKANGNGFDELVITSP